MDDSTTEDYLRKVIKGGGVFAPKRMLVWDAFAAHKSVKTTALLEELGLVVAYIPGGCTKFIQVAPDVSWNKPFKGHVRDCYTTWMSNDAEKGYAPAGNPKAPPLHMVLRWIDCAWKEISKETIVKSFKTLMMVIKSNKGKVMAQCDQHLMRMNSKSSDGTKQFWRCATQVCHGTAESTIGSVENLKERKQHDLCVPSPDSITTKQRRTEVKDTAKQDLAMSSSSILTAAKRGLSIAELESFPKDSNIKRQVTNARRPAGGADVDKHPSLMVLSEAFRTTNAGERFLIYDSRILEPEKPVIIMLHFVIPVVIPVFV